MTLKVAFRVTAEADLERIFDYIAQDSPRNAIEFTRRIREQCHQLGDFPQCGTRRDDLAPGVRTIGFRRRVTIVFRVLPDRVQIVAISYGSRDLTRMLKRGWPV